MINFFKKHFDGLSKRLIGGAAGSFGLNIVNQAFLLGITMILTRLMTPEGYGLYAVILSAMLLLALPFAGGFPTFVIKNVGALAAQKKYQNLRGLMDFSALWVIIGGGLLYAALYAVMPYVVGDQSPYYRQGLALILLPPLLVLSGAILRGLRYVLWGRFPEFFVQPAILFGVLAVFFLLGVQDISTQIVLGLHIASYTLALGVALILLFLFLPKDIKQARPKYEIKTWIKSALPLMVAVGIVVINTNIDIVMVGAMAGETEAGQYRVASRLAGFVLFFLLAANNTIGALIAGQHAIGEYAALQSTLTSVARLTVLATIPVAAILWIWPQEILGLLFGAPFVVGATALMILVTANFFSVSMGQVGHVLSMTGHEKYTAYAALAALITNVKMNYFLIPLYGIDGAAFATGSSIILWNLLLAYWCARKTGYRCGVFGSFKK